MLNNQATAWRGDTCATVAAYNHDMPKGSDPSICRQLLTVDDPVAIVAFIGACVASILAGIGLAFGLEDARWLWLCLPVVFFL